MSTRDHYWALLHRMVRRSDGDGFTFWLRQYIDDRKATMGNAERKIHEKSLEHIGGLVFDSHELEKILEGERAAHRSERLANIELSRINADQKERLELLERQNKELRAFLDSGEISLPDEHQQEEGGRLR